MDLSHSFELRARDMRRVVGAHLHLTRWDVGFEPGNEWISTSTDSPDRRANLVCWLESKKVDASSEFIRFESFSNTLQRFRWREILEQPQAVFVGDSWKMVSSDLRWVFDFMHGSVRFGALKEEPNQSLQPTTMSVTDRAGARSAPATVVADL